MSTDTLSPTVRAWALAMQQELDANARKDGDGGWQHCTPDVLWNDTMYHAMKLNYALKHGETDKVCEFAADTANMAMMTRDVYLARLEGAQASAAEQAEPVLPPEPVEPAQRYAERNGVMLPVLVVTPQEFKDLLEYSHTLPTGKIIGKRWKAYQRRYQDDPAQVADLNNWAIGEYTRKSETHPGMIDMTWYAPEYSAEAGA